MAEIRLNNQVSDAERLALKRSLMQEMMDCGYSRTDTNQVFDLAEHACWEAQRAMTRTLNALPQHLKAPATALAMQQLELLMKHGQKFMLALVEEGEQANGE